MVPKSNFVYLATLATPRFLASVCFAFGTGCKYHLAVVAPSTVLGKTVAAVIMILGYSMIIVPTGIISAELAQTIGKPITTQACPNCMAEGHDRDAVYCKLCGYEL